MTNNLNFKRQIPSNTITFNKNGEILLCRRISSDKLWHDKWEFPGGTIEFGEDPKQTAMRETKEETGIDVEILSDYPIVMNYADKNNNQDFICISFIAKYKSGEITIGQDDGVSDVKWISPININYDDCLPLTKEIVDESLKLIKNYEY
jgi:8-oxo-dGTP diphosphatase